MSNVPDNRTVYNTARNELALYLLEKMDLSRGTPFDQIDARMTSPITPENLDKIYELDAKIAACYLKMREIITKHRTEL